MRRRLTLVVLAVLLIPAAAVAKGPTAARITGLPSGPLTVEGQPGSGEPGSGGTLAELAEATGLWANTFDGDSALVERPAGELGTRLRISWVVPGPTGDDIAVQDVYPWAEGGAVTFTRPGQDYAGTTTRGGWFAGGDVLHGMLVDVGAPEREPTSGPLVPLPALVAIIAAVFGAVGLAAWQRLSRREADAVVAT